MKHSYTSSSAQKLVTGRSGWELVAHLPRAGHTVHGGCVSFVKKLVTVLDRHGEPERKDELGLDGTDFFPHQSFHSLLVFKRHERPDKT